MSKKINVVCFYDSHGDDVWRLITESLLLFIQSELAKDSAHFS